MKKILLSLFFFYHFISFSYINIHPIEFEKNITYGAGEEFKLYNRSTKVRKYRVYVEEVEDKKSMAEWIEVYPRSITLEPLKEERVKIYITPPSGTEEGEYQAKLVIKEIALPIPEAEKEDIEKKHRVLTMVKIKLKGKVEHE